MEGKPQPPHGLMGIDTSSPFPYEMLLSGVILAIVLILLLIFFYKHRIRSQGAQVPTLDQELAALRLELQSLDLSSVPSLAEQVSLISLKLRRSFELLTELPLSDLTSEEINMRLPQVWPLTRPYGDFIAILDHCDRLKFQRASQADHDVAEILQQSLSWVDEAITCARHKS